MSDSNNNNPDTSTSKKYEEEIAALKAQLSKKDEEMTDLQRGLEAQVQMVMELEKLEQKELQEYELKIQANKKLIGELGERVGQESKSKAELESQLVYVRAQNKDLSVQVERMGELSKVNADLLQAATKPQYTTADNRKLEYMMTTNQKLVMELAQAQEDIQTVRKDVSDKELLCLELSSQLDKLASQLNSADEDMALVKHHLKQKEEQFEKVDQRVKFLEKAILEEDNSDDTADETETGKAALMKELQAKDQQMETLQKERNVSLAKATKLSFALAATREHVDALQEQMASLATNNNYNKFMGMRNHNNNPQAQMAPNNNNNMQSNAATDAATTTTNPTKATPKRSGSWAGKALRNNSGASNSDTDAPKTGPFAGRRIRNFFQRGNINTSDNAASNGTPGNSSHNSNPGSGSLPSPPLSNGGGGGGGGGGKNIISTPPTLVKPTLGFRASNTPPTDSNGNKATLIANGNKANASGLNKDGVDPLLGLPSLSKTNGGKNGNTNNNNNQQKRNPFDDDLNASFVNTSVGKPSHIDEAVQGGGGDVNLALTL